MKPEKLIPHSLNSLFIAAVMVLLFTGCQPASEKPAASTTPAVASPAPMTPAMPASETKSVVPLRIKAGATEGFTDRQGNVWVADEGFVDGETDDRPDVTITNATDPRIYQSERYSMSRFMQALPNGKYIVKLHFCETYDGITGPGGRVFSFNVAGQEFKDFDVWVKAGGPQRAYVETVPVDITDGKLVIIFTPNVENPEINGIEILPAA